uniref:Pentatricopeptide repeat-containing protein n=1 Tax=Kalanchoe fedtschenkoi TaxID=63787 RepID=A0A7N0V5P4_KALFE
MLNTSSYLSRASNFSFQSVRSLLDRCQSMFELKRIHAVLVTVGSPEYDPCASALLSFAALSENGDVDYASRVFWTISNPNIFDWNTIIRGYSKSRTPNKSLLFYVKMLRSGVAGDYLTFPFLAKASARLMSLKHGLAVHGCVVKNGFSLDMFVQNSLIHMYCSCGDVAYARQVFDEIANRNVVSWNSMLDGYCKCKMMDLAREVFDEMPERDVVSWSSLIDGYVKVGEHTEALALFSKMQLSGPKANAVTMVSVLCACAHLGKLDQGRCMHRYMNENKLPFTLVLQTSLVDMYAKCGAIEEAFDVFRGASKFGSDVLIWNAMIGGLATHGLVLESLELFTEMQAAKIKPDEITYLCLLNACAHGGLVEEAWGFYESLKEFGAAPKCEHYACMVDVLARAGKLNEAYHFICEMPIEPTASMLGALLSGSINHGRLELAETVGKKLIELDPSNDGRYVGLSNVYSIVKRWDDAKSMRQVMERKGVKKSPGCSAVEVNNIHHSFIAHDKTHPMSETIYKVLNHVIEEMKPELDTETGEYKYLSDCF